MREARIGVRYALHKIGRAKASRSARLRLTVVSLAALAVTLAATPAAFAQTTQYAVGKPACPSPKPGHAQCMAVRKVVVKATTPDALPFVRGAGAKPGAATIGPAGGVTPADLATAYGFNATAATTQTVAIVDAFNDPKINADLQTFDTHYGLAACSTANGCLKVVISDRNRARFRPMTALAGLSRSRWTSRPCIRSARSARSS